MASSSSDSSDTGDLLSKNGNGNGSSGRVADAGNGNAGGNINSGNGGGARPVSSAPADALASQLVSLLSQQNHQQQHAHQYVNYNSTILLSLRPPTIADSAPDDVSTSLNAHIADYYDFEGSDEDDRPLQPHVYELAAKAYYYLRRTGQDQGIVFQSAVNTEWTGQHEHRRLATRALLSISSNAAVDPATGSTASKSHKIARQVQAAEFIIDAFGSTGGGDASILSTPRFGRYSEIQYNDRGRVMGFKTLLYNLDLDTDRITFNLTGGPVNGIQNKERTFNAIRWLAAGASVDERIHLKLPQTEQLGLEKRQFDRERFGLFKQAFKAFGFPKKAGEWTQALLQLALFLLAN
jgi:chitin synthase